MTLFTTRLATGESVNIVKADSVFYLSIKANGGISTILGNVASFKGIATAPVDLEDGQTFSVVTSPSQALDGVTITASTGATDIVIGF